MSKIADDSESIAKRLKEIEAERLQALTGDEAKPADPAPVVWPMYGAAANLANQGYAGQLGGLSNNTLGATGQNPYQGSGNGATTFTPSDYNELYRGLMAQYPGAFNLPDLRGRVKASG